MRIGIMCVSDVEYRKSPTYNQVESIELPPLYGSVCVFVYVYGVNYISHNDQVAFVQ